MIHDAQQKKKKYTDNGMKWQPEVIGVVVRYTATGRDNKQEKKKNIRDKKKKLVNSLVTMKKNLEYSRHLHRKQKMTASLPREAR